MSPKFQTLVELFESRSTSTKPWLILPKDAIASDDAERVTFSGMVAEARRVARALQNAAVSPGDALLLVFDNGIPFCATFLGALVAGVVPVPVAPPFITSRLTDYVERVALIAGKSSARWILTSSQLSPVFETTPIVGVRVLALDAFLSTFGDDSPPAPTRAEPTDLAFLQFSSGSTGQPRGAMLTHENVLWNVHGIGTAVNASSDESALCWLPLHHDMGLSALFLYTLYWDMSLVLMSPVDFIVRPASFLWAMSRFGCAGTAAPNFAYALCASSRVKESELDGLDLSKWRVAFSGAESVQVASVDAFVERFSRHGFRREALRPAYGLAENVAACTLGGEAGLDVHVVDRDELERNGFAVPPRDERTRAMVSVGRAIEGTELRVVDPSGEALPERAVGEIQIRGRSRTRGYHGDPAATLGASTPDGWLRTGDLGYVHDGNLYVVGRIKELIKKAGARYDAADMQAVVSRVNGVRPGCVAIFGVDDAALGTEAIVVVAETSREPDTLASLADEIRRAVATTFATAPDVVHFVRPGSLPKTSSGKTQVVECRRLYLEHALDVIPP